MTLQDQSHVRKARAALRAETRRVVAEIRTLIEPVLWPSGYVRDNNPFGDKAMLRIAVFPEHRGTRFRKVGTANVAETMGFTEDGVIVDQLCAIVTTDWKALELDDARALLPVARRLVAVLSKQTKNAA